MFRRLKRLVKRKKNSVRKKIAYLAGPMEYALDNGYSWRLQFRRELKPLNIECIIPETAEQNIVSSVDEYNRLKRVDIDKYINITRKIISFDLALIDTVDMVVTKYEGEQMSGTIGEAQYTFRHNIPNYLVTSKPFHEVPGWFLACFTEKFHSLAELVNFLQKTGHQ